jgi:hypothetical protein
MPYFLKQFTHNNGFSSGISYSTESRRRFFPAAVSAGKPEWQGRRGSGTGRVSGRHQTAGKAETMENQNKTRYFLGANSGDGFHSLYEDFVDCAGGDFLWVIKGGPGCGKSEFMAHIAGAAESAGLEVEYILCPGDPEIIDAIYLPKLRTAYVDGTAPHVMDTPLPGAGGLYLDLGAFYDADSLVPWLGEISELFASCQALYARAYDLLAAAARVTPERLPELDD